jgi:SAM-dependent methyltransferase
MNAPSSLQHNAEAEFHDKWAEETAVESVEVVAAFEALTAMENRFILKLLGNLRDRRILDIGCGLGESSIYFAMQGAKVTALDISPKMVELTLQNARLHGLEVEGVVGTGESLNVPDDSFDIVYAANVLHHIQDRAQVYENVRRCLKPGGTFVAWDPLKYNPAINVYRRKASKVRTESESPLGFEDFELSRKYFPNLQHREFWFGTLALFFKYYLVDRYDPGEVRYWKRILKETSSTIGFWFSPLAALDNLLLSLPFVRRMAWNSVQWGTKASGR